MKPTNRFQRMIRWFPPKWSDRYGAGMVALLEDTYGDGEVPWRARLALARAGSLERAREFGLIGSATGVGERLRAGSFVILCGWSLFMIAGADFAKFSEHWNVATPTADLTLPNLGYDIVAGAAVAGILLVLLAATLCLPALLTYLRAGNWSIIRRPVLRVVLVGLSLVVFTFGFSVWAHLLNYRDRNGGLVPYQIIFLLWCGAVIVALLMATGAAITVTRRLDLSRRLLGALSAMAVTLTFLMAAIVAGTALWWGNESFYAPHFMRVGMGSGIVLVSSTFPLSLVFAGVLMLLGLVLAVVGVVRVRRATRSTSVAI